MEVFLRRSRNSLGEDDTDLFVGDAHGMSTIEGSRSSDKKGPVEPTTPTTKITKGKRPSRTMGVTRAIKADNPNADCNPSRKDHNSNKNGESRDE
ncbi:hypothetical protein CSOJ01_04110 [Colletotrichum sojae]|uniref:Uncharacterized protein n=1 Tax=Colletotrichum sojae TaxID=2175907 RepID=A0A8H6JK32_9PEZI|nr:hypothetical protein CSOJ01_04110 [Colletotrichum sojae]